MGMIANPNRNFGRLDSFFQAHSMFYTNEMSSESARRAFKNVWKRPQAVQTSYLTAKLAVQRLVVTYGVSTQNHLMPIGPPK